MVQLPGLAQIPHSSFYNAGRFLYEQGQQSALNGSNLQEKPLSQSNGRAGRVVNTGSNYPTLNGINE